MKKHGLLILSLILPLSTMSIAADNADQSTGIVNGYNLPPKNILDVMTAPATPIPLVSPTHDYVLLVAQQTYPSISLVATPFLRLAGVRVETRNHSKHDTPGGYGITPYASDYWVVQVATGHQTHVELPVGSCPELPLWSADGKRFAFSNITSDSVQLWIGEAASGVAHQVPNVHLNPMLGNELQWLPDQKSLLVKLVPDGIGAPPAEPVIPDGPSIQQSDGKSGQSSTYENRDTLNNRHDEDLFDYYGMTQLAKVDAVTSALIAIGNPGIYSSVDMAPDGKHLLVTTLHKPYSHVTTYERFPMEVDVWSDPTGVNVSRSHIATLPLADRVPIHGVPLGPRDFAWRATEPATLVWAEALDGGDWNVKVPARDKVMLLSAPFAVPATEIIRTEQRFAGFDWTEKKSIALMFEFDQNRHWLHTSTLNVDEKPVTAHTLWDFSTDEKYAHPGYSVHRQLADGSQVIQLEGNALYLSGMGASKDGDRPFLDKLDLTTKKTVRLFRSGRDDFERFLAFSSGDAGHFMTWHQSIMDTPNVYMRTLGARVAAAKDEAEFASTTVAVTHIPDPTPEVRKIKKQLVKYKRDDGVELSFTLYTPPDYQQGTRVPAILYAYPLDYADAKKAGQVTGSQNTFTRLRDYRLLLLAGYAIIDNAAFPIVGDPKKAYDTYMKQLVADAKAAVDAAVKLGVVDANRIGVTGHSHGALMTANLVAHSTLFRAGVATSGSYNKTLTPFGFQSERRSVWEATDVYLKVSPFFYADKLKTPLLIVHGADDANPGTTPLQASKLFEAIRGNGGTTRLVMLPHEPHWYTALESNEQLIYEMMTWFDKYVKNAPAPVAAKAH